MEQNLYEAVIEQAIQDWAFGGQFHKDASRFLFHDDGFDIICQHAGLDSSLLRSKLHYFMPQVRSRYAG